MYSIQIQLVLSYYKLHNGLATNAQLQLRFSHVVLEFNITVFSESCRMLEYFISVWRQPMYILKQLF